MASFVRASSKGQATGTTLTVVLGGTPTNGNLLVAYSGLDQNGRGIFAPAGWTKVRTVNNAAGGAIQGDFFWKIAYNESTNFIFTCDTAASQYLVEVAEYSGDGIHSWFLAKENGQTQASGVTQTTPTVTPSEGMAGVIIGMCSIDVQTTFSGQTINGSTTGVNERVDSADSQVNGVTVTLWDKLETTVSGGYVGVATAAAGADGVTQIAVFINGNPGFPNNFQHASARTSNAGIISVTEKNR